MIMNQTHDAIIFNVMDVTECCCKAGSGFYPIYRMNLNQNTRTK